MKITEAKLRALEPCGDRWLNYWKHYAGREFTPAQFLMLKKITAADKHWVAFRLMRPERAVQAAAEIAESVLHIYEAAHPGDDRPRRAIAAAKRQDPDAASYAARAAYAASYAAHAAAYAARAAAYAAAAAPARTQQEAKNLRIIRKWWR